MWSDRRPFVVLQSVAIGKGKKNPYVCVWVFTTSDSLESNYSPLFIRSFVSLIIQLCLIPQWECTQWGHMRRKRHLSCSIVVKVSQSCPTLCDPMGCTSRGIFQAIILEWVAFPFSKGSSQPKGQTQVSCIAGGFFTSWPRREALLHNKDSHFQMNHFDWMTLILLTFYTPS